MWTFNKLATPLEQFSILDVNHEFFFTKLSQIFIDLFRSNTNFILDFLPTNVSDLNTSTNYINLITDVNVFFSNYDIVFIQNFTMTLFIFGVFLDYIIFGKSIIIQVLSGIFIFIYNLTKKQLNTVNFNFSFILLVIGFFVTTSNLIGMITYSTTPTAQLALTYFLAAWFMHYVNSSSLVLHNVKFFGMFFPTGSPLALAFLIIPIEAISYFFRKISLSVRLFANMMAGHTLLKVFAGFIYTYLITFQLTIIVNSSIAFLLINPVLIALTGLEVGVAFIQGYVFLSLTAMYATDSKDLH